MVYAGVFDTGVGGSIFTIHMAATQEDDYSFYVTIGILIIFLVMVFMLYRLFLLHEIKYASPRVQAILNLNDRISFLEEPSRNKPAGFMLSKRFSSHAQFERFDVMKAFEKDLKKFAFDEQMIWSEPVIRYFKPIFANMRTYKRKYRPLLKRIYKRHGKLSADKVKFIRSTWYVQRLERELCQKYMYHPTQPKNAAMHVQYRYDTPAGRNHYAKEYMISGFEYKDVWDRIYGKPEAPHKKGMSTVRGEVHYNSKSMFAKHQRSLMTAKMRYRILKRDGFCCQICGRSQSDGVKLHVDHIKPVVAGGRTVASNLRTLCQDCNLGKSSEYDVDKVN